MSMKKKDSGKRATDQPSPALPPFFSDKYAKIGLQINELYYDDILEEQLKKILEIFFPSLIAFLRKREVSQR